MTGNLSTPTRQLSSQAQTLKREARRAQRAGFSRAAEQLYLAGAHSSVQEKGTRGSGLRSAEEEMSTEAQLQKGAAASNAQRAANIQRSGQIQPVAPAQSSGQSVAPAQGINQLQTPQATGEDSSTKTSPGIDYFSPKTSVEQTKEEGDAIRRKALQDAYNKLTNPTGEAGSIKERLEQQVAKNPAQPAKKEPTFQELLDPLKAYFDKRDSEKRAAEVANRPIVIGGVAQPQGYGSKVTQSQKDAESEQQAAARVMDQRPPAPPAQAQAQESADAPPERKISATNPARLTGRLIRQASNATKLAKVGTLMAADKVTDTVLQDPLLKSPTASEQLDQARRKKTLKEMLAPARGAGREFMLGLQGQ